MQTRDWTRLMLAGTTALAGWVAAQTAPAGKTDEVIVTAQRRAEPVQKTPLAITALTASALKAAGVVQTEDLAKLVPSLAIGQAGPNLQVYVRGVGTSASNSFAEPAVAVNLDGVYLARPTAMDDLFFDLQCVEVLKGPQGTLYGRNSIGGAINVISQKPTNQFGGNLTLEAGDYGRFRTEGALNVPFSPVLAARIAFQTVKHNGYLTDGYDDQDTASARASLLYTPSDDLSAQLSGDFSHDGGKGNAGVLTPFVDPSNPWLGPSEPSESAIRALMNGKARFPANIVNPYIGTGLPPVPDTGSLDGKAWGIAADIERRFEPVNLTLLVSHRQSSLDSNSYDPQFLTRFGENAPATSAEARLASASGTPLNWVGGVYYFTEHEHVDQFTDQFLNYSKSQYQLDNNAYAAFGQATYSLTRHWRITGGLRYTYEDKSLEGIRGTQKPVAPPPACTLGGTYQAGAVPLCLYPVGGALSFRAINYRAGIDYDIAPQSLLYASVNTGYKAGGFFAGLPPDTFKPENLTAYALGSKNQFLGRRLTLNGELYYWDYKNHQESFFGPIFPGPTTGFITGNIGKMTIEGVDTDARWRVTGADTLSAQIAYTYSDYNNFVYPIGSSVATTSCVPTGALVGTAHVVNCSGHSLIRTPRWSATLGYDHDFLLHDGSQLQFSVASHLETKSEVTINFEAPSDLQPAYHKTDISLTYTTADQRFSLSGWARNLENTAVITSGTFGPGFGATTNGGPVYGAMNIEPPRTFGFIGTWNFE